MRSFVHARAMGTAFLALSAFGAPARVAHADEAAPSTSTQTNAASDEERLRKLKSEGDRALAERRLGDAIKAYDVARAIRRDPLIAGRMGLAISFYDDPRAFEEAANLLYIAVSDAAGASSQEKDAFFAAYKRMRKLVCKLSIDTNDVNARVDYGKGVKAQHTSFFVFVKKGKGEAVAKLEGREDIRQTWDCAGDHDIDLRFDFPPVVAEPAKTIAVTEKSKETVKIVYESIPVENPIAKPETTARNRFTVAVGPVVVFRASPSPSFGVSLAVNYSFGSYSAMIAARGAWSSTSIANANINAFVLTTMGGPCARWKWFDACIAPSITSVQYRAADNSHYVGQTNSQIIPGLGVTMGMTRKVSSAFALRLAGDFTVLSDTVTFTQEAQNQPFLTWDGGRVLIGVALMAILSP